MNTAALVALCLVSCGLLVQALVLHNATAHAAARLLFLVIVLYATALYTRRR